MLIKKLINFYLSNILSTENDGIICRLEHYQQIINHIEIWTLW